MVDDWKDEWKEWGIKIYSRRVSCKIYVACFACYLVTFKAAIEKSVDSLELTNTPERLR